MIRGVLGIILGVDCRTNCYSSRLFLFSPFPNGASLFPSCGRRSLLFLTLYAVISYIIGQHDELHLERRILFNSRDRRSSGSVGRKHFFPCSYLFQERTGFNHSEECPRYVIVYVHKKILYGGPQ